MRLRTGCSSKVSAALTDSRDCLLKKISSGLKAAQSWVRGDQEQKADLTGDAGRISFASLCW